ncbi:uncharacterized protein K452DRAFT_343030, partial [Aplosporella prunicola CBS 121167]
GSAWEAGPFVFRALGAYDQQNTAYATVAQQQLLLAPLWINAFAYMAAGRAAFCFAPAKRVLRLNAARVGSVFVWADVGSFVVQAVGGAMLSPGASVEAKRLGLRVYMAGVGVQQLFVCVFAVGVVQFHWVMSGVERRGWAEGEGMRVGKNDEDGRPRGGCSGWLYRNWRALVWALYTVLALITVRITFRLVEFARGITPANTILYNENYVLLLDALPMVLALLVLALVHPGAVLRGADSELPARRAWWRCCGGRRAGGRDETGAQRWGETGREEAGRWEAGWRNKEEHAQRQWENDAHGWAGQGVVLTDFSSGGKASGNEGREWRGERRRSSLWSPLER